MLVLHGACLRFPPGGQWYQARREMLAYRLASTQSLPRPDASVESIDGRSALKVLHPLQSHRRRTNRDNLDNADRTIGDCHNRRSSVHPLTKVAIEWTGCNRILVLYLPCRYFSVPLISPTGGLLAGRFSRRFIATVMELPSTHEDVKLRTGKRR